MNFVFKSILFCKKKPTLVISFGAGLPRRINRLFRFQTHRMLLPGIKAVVMIISTSFACLANRAISASINSGDIS